MTPQAASASTAARRARSAGQSPTSPACGRSADTTKPAGKFICQAGLKFGGNAAGIKAKKWWRDPVLPGILFHVQNQTGSPFFTLKNVGFGSLRHTKNNLRQTAKKGNRAAIMVRNGNTRTAFNAQSFRRQYTTASAILQMEIAFLPDLRSAEGVLMPETGGYRRLNVPRPPLAGVNTPPSDSCKARRASQNFESALTFSTHIM